MGVGQKEWSRIDTRVSGKEPGVTDATWVGGVNTSRSGDTQVGSMDIVSRAVVWVSATAPERMEPCGWAAWNWVAKWAWGIML